MENPSNGDVGTCRLFPASFKISVATVQVKILAWHTSKKDKLSTRCIALKVNEKHMETCGHDFLIRYETLTERQVVGCNVACQSKQICFSVCLVIREKYRFDVQFPIILFRGT